jgi:hypothetical protein
MALALSGCSLMFIPKVNKQKPMSCNPDRTHVAADAVWAGVDFFPALIFFVLSVPHDTCVNQNCTHHPGDPKWIGTSIIFGGAMVTHLISAKVGLDRTRACRAAREEYQRRQAPAYPSYPAYPYPPQQSYPYPPQQPYPVQPNPYPPAPSAPPPQPPGPQSAPVPPPT